MCDSSDSDKEQELIDFIDEFSVETPTQFLKRETSKDSTLVRAQNHAVYCVIDQMRIPLSHEAENVSKWIIYKQAAPQKHQKYFGFFRTLYKHVKQYNEVGLLKKLNAVYKKAIDSGNSGELYPFEEAAIRFIGCAYLRRIFLLKKIREDCLKTSRYSIGMIEINQWTNLALVIVAVCGDVYSDVGRQIIAIEKAYKHGMKVFRKVDHRFPEDVESLRVVQDLKATEGCLDKISDNFASLTKILKFTSERMTKAQTENSIEHIKSEVLEMILKSPEEDGDGGMRKEERRGIEIGVAISRDDISLIGNSSAVFDSSINEDSLLSPFLFGKPKKKTKKRKSETQPILHNLVESSNENSKIKKKKKRKN